MSEVTEQQQTARTAGGIGMIAFMGAIIGFFLQLTVAYFFGASQSTDAYFMALSTSELLGRILLGGSVTALFLPIFVDKLVAGKREEAWQLALNLLHVSAVLMSILLLALAFFTEPFVHFIAPGFDAETTALTVRILRVLLPAFLFYFLSDLGVAILHSLKMFWVPAIIRIIAPLFPIITLLLWAESLGIYSLALGTLLSAAVQFCFLFYILKREKFKYRFVFNLSDPTLRKLFNLVYPFIFSALVTQGAGIVYRILVSDLTPGSLSALRYAEKITQLITIIFLNSVTMVIYPLLSEKVSRRDYSGVRDTVAAAIRLTTFVCVPIIIGIVILRENVIVFIYGYGSFSAEAIELTSAALLFLVIGLATNAISSILGHATLALQKSRASVAVTIISNAIAIYLFVLLVPRMAHAGLALASSLVPLSSVVLYFLYLNRYVHNLKSVFWHTTYLKIMVLSVVLAAVLYMSTTYTNALELSAVANAVTLGILSLLGASVYFGGAKMWHVPEMQDVLTIAGRTLSSWRKKYRPA